MHLEVYVEEPSAEAALSILIPKIVGPAVTFQIHPHQGKADLLRKLPAKLRAYRTWLPEDWRIVILLDADGAVCEQVKEELENLAAAAGLVTRRTAPARFQVLTRIAIEELEAWFLGDIEALRAAYSRVPASLARRAGMRNPDAIRGGTWEMLERTLQRCGYHRGGLPKSEAARRISRHMDPARNRSASFRAFRDGLARCLEPL